MQRQWLVRALYWSGVFLLFVHTTGPALWQVLGLPGAYPLASTKGLLGLAAGFTPPLGAASMLLAGFVQGSAASPEAER